MSDNVIMRKRTFNALQLGTARWPQGPRVESKDTREGADRTAARLCDKEARNVAVGSSQADISRQETARKARAQGTDRTSSSKTRNVERQVGQYVPSQSCELGR